jgi:hypothetical protein
MMLTRRRFIQLLSGLTVSSVLPSCGNETPAPLPTIPPTPKPLRISQSWYGLPIEASRLQGPLYMELTDVFDPNQGTRICTLSILGLVKFDPVKDPKNAHGQVVKESVVLAGNKSDTEQKFIFARTELGEIYRLLFILSPQGCLLDNKAAKYNDTLDLKWSETKPIETDPSNIMILNPSLNGLTDGKIVTINSISKEEYDRVNK